MGHRPMAAPHYPLLRIMLLPTPIHTTPRTIMGPPHMSIINTPTICRGSVQVTIPRNQTLPRGV